MKAHFRLSPRTRFALPTAYAAFALLAALCLPAQPLLAQAHPTDDATSDAKTEPAWTTIPTNTSEHWEVCNFGGEGDVSWGKDSVVMKAGDPLTGVRCTAKLPRDQYEISVECRRLSNFDFFCGLTFPVGDEKCSFIVGGWAGAIVGLSSINGEDASENKTKRFMSFDNERWYKVRVRVDEQHVRCWIDDKLVVEQPREGHSFDIRVEMDLCRPLGIAAFMCDAEFRNFRWRPVPKS